MEQNKKPMDWLNRKLQDPDFRREFETEWASLRFTEEFESALERENQTKSGVARKLGKSRSFVTQCLRRGRNLTIKTMAELANSLGYELKISMKKRSANISTFDVTLESITLWKFRSDEVASQIDEGLDWSEYAVYVIGAHGDPEHERLEESQDPGLESIASNLQWVEPNTHDNLVH